MLSVLSVCLSTGVKETGYHTLIHTIRFHLVHLSESYLRKVHMLSTVQALCVQERVMTLKKNVSKKEAVIRILIS